MDLWRFFHLIVYGNLKTFNIMSKHRIVFHDECDPEEEGSYYPQIETFLNVRDCVTILIEDSNNTESYQMISLDKSTAIKFAKTLRTEINKIKEVVNV